MTSLSSNLKIYFVIGEPNETLTLATLVGRLTCTRAVQVLSRVVWGVERLHASTNLSSFTFLLLHPSF